MRKAGVDSQTVKGKGNQMFSKRSFHALRHGFTSALANQNVPSELRMKLTGHSTEGEHKKYTHPELDHLRATVEKIPSLGWLNFTCLTSANLCDTIVILKCRAKCDS